MGYSHRLGSSLRGYDLSGIALCAKTQSLGLRRLLLASSLMIFSIDGPLPDVMQHVDVPIITNKECEGMYRRAGYIEDIPNIFICAGLAKGAKDSCEVSLV